MDGSSPRRCLPTVWASLAGRISAILRFERARNCGHNHPIRVLFVSAFPRMAMELEPFLLVCFTFSIPVFCLSLYNRITLG